MYATNQGGLYHTIITGKRGEEAVLNQSNDTLTTKINLVQRLSLILMTTVASFQQTPPAAPVELPCPLQGLRSAWWILENEVSTLHFRRIRL